MNCTICSDPIEGKPLLSLDVDWADLPPCSYDLCSPDCVRHLMSEWADHLGAPGDLGHALIIEYCPPDCPRCARAKARP